MKRIMLVVVLSLVFPAAVFAEMNADLRIKLGSVPGVDTLEISGINADTSSSVSTNAQLEISLSPGWENTAGFVMGLGVFSRTHAGKTEGTSNPMEVKYKVNGISIAPGLRIAGSEHFHFEAKVEFGLGESSGVTLTSPGTGSIQTRNGTYASTSLIFGWYYSFGTPGAQLGLELGAQKFVGDFDVWNNSSFYTYWDGGSVDGSGALANVTLGWRF